MSVRVPETTGSCCHSDNGVIANYVGCGTDLRRIESIPGNQSLAMSRPLLLAWSEKKNHERLRRSYRASFHIRAAIASRRHVSPAPSRRPEPNETAAGIEVHSPAARSLVLKNCGTRFCHGADVSRQLRSHIW